LINAFDGAAAAAFDPMTGSCPSCVPALFSKQYYYAGLFLSCLVRYPYSDAPRKPVDC
jgi:hypothetical protein